MDGIFDDSLFPNLQSDTQPSPDTDGGDDIAQGISDAASPSDEGEDAASDAELTLADAVSARYEKNSAMSFDSLLDTAHFPAFRLGYDEPDSPDEDAQPTEEDEPLPELFNIPKPASAEPEAAEPLPELKVPDLFAGIGKSEDELSFAEEQEAEPPEPEVHEDELFDMIESLEEDIDAYRKQVDEMFRAPEISHLSDPYNTHFNMAHETDDDIPTISLDHKYELQ
ncbi:MAG: hypothetical protein IJP17_04740 [Clostridia bacterium]|nr:hypothetical protein [Clostridia bacterium]